MFNVCSVCSTRAFPTSGYGHAKAVALWRRCAGPLETSTSCWLWGAADPASLSSAITWGRPCCVFAAPCTTGRGTRCTLTGKHANIQHTKRQAGQQSTYKEASKPTVKTQRGKLANSQLQRGKFANSQHTKRQVHQQSTDKEAAHQSNWHWINLIPHNIVQEVCIHIF